MWKPNKARSAALQVCASLLLRPDDVENEVVQLASAALFNPTAFANETEFSRLLHQTLGWNKDHVDSLLEQIGMTPTDKST